MCTDKNTPVEDLTQENTISSDFSESQNLAFHSSTLAAKISACVEAKYENGQICVNFPVIGDICFKVSLPLPSGSSVKVCMETCGYKFTPPFFKGVKATVYVGSQALWTGTIWGHC